MQEYSVFQETSQLDQDLEIDGIVARIILVRLGKDRDSTKFFLHERPAWSGVEPGKMQIYGGSNVYFLKLKDKSENTLKKLVKEAIALKEFDGTQIEEPETTAHRELREELGLRKQEIEYMGANVYGLTPESQWLNYYYFLPRKRAYKIKDKSGQTHTRKDPKGAPLRHGWFTLKEINDPSFEMAFNHKEVLNQAYDYLRDLQRTRENN